MKNKHSTFQDFITHCRQQTKGMDMSLVHEKSTEKLAICGTGEDFWIQLDGLYDIFNLYWNMDNAIKIAKLIATFLHTKEQSNRPLTILDVGTGKGSRSKEVMQALFDCSLVSHNLDIIDTSEKAINIAQSLLPAHTYGGYLKNSYTNFSQITQSYDALLLYASIYYFLSPAALQQLLGMLNDKGKIAMVFINNIFDITTYLKTHLSHLLGGNCRFTLYPVPINFFVGSRPDDIHSGMAKLLNAFLGTILLPDGALTDEQLLNLLQSYADDGCINLQHNLLFVEKI